MKQAGVVHSHITHSRTIRIAIRISTVPKYHIIKEMGQQGYKNFNYCGYMIVHYSSLFQYFIIIPTLIENSQFFVYCTTYNILLLLMSIPLTPKALTVQQDFVASFKCCSLKNYETIFHRYQVVTKINFHRYLLMLTMYRETKSS